MRQMTPKDPGPNGWVANQDPITLIGDLAITDATVTVLAKLNLVADGLGDGAGDGAGNPPALQLLQCDAAAKTQQWSYNKPYPRYYANAETGLCLNQVGCGPNSPVIQYNCEAPGATQCANLEWRLTADAQLVVNATGQCVTAGPDHTAHTADCVSPVPASQRWSDADGTLRNGDLCLSTPPVQEYLAVCARISSFAAFDGTKANNGVCLRLIFVDGGSGLTWSLLESTTVLAHGSVAAALPSTWHELALTVSGATATASLNGSVLGSAHVVNATHGMASLGSSYSDAMYDRFSLKLDDDESAGLARSGTKKFAAFNHRGAIDLSRSTNVEPVLGRARQSSLNPLFGEDKQWETSTTYPNVAYDSEGGERRFQLWYTTIIFDNKYHAGAHANTSALFPHGRREFGVAYAHSADGETWVKPSLGVVSFLNSTDNNLICVGCSGIGVMRDAAEVNASRRYKAFGTWPNVSQHSACSSPQGCANPHDIEESLGAGGGGTIAFSADGISWRPEDLASITREVSPLGCPGHCDPVSGCNCSYGLGMRWDTHNNL